MAAFFLVGQAKHVAEYLLVYNKHMLPIEHQNCNNLNVKIENHLIFVCSKFDESVDNWTTWFAICIPIWIWYEGFIPLYEQSA